MRQLQKCIKLKIFTQDTGTFLDAQEPGLEMRMPARIFQFLAIVHIKF